MTSECVHIEHVKQQYKNLKLDFSFYLKNSFLNHR